VPTIYRAEGLAWDDDPGYMKDLAQYLEQLEIRLEVVRTPNDFLSYFGTRAWSFVVLDLLDESESPPKKKGIDLAKNVAMRSDPFFPIFLITGETAHLQPELFEALPLNANVRYKIADTYPMAWMIRDELRLRGVYTDPRKTFLVAPMERNRLSPEGLEIQRWLNERGQNITPLSQRMLNAEIIRTLQEEMAASKAVIVLCTADDPWPDQTRHPRQNVILELGMALGTGRGLRSLVILKQGNAVMPSDLGGVVTLNFDKSPSEIFDQLEERLLTLGVDLSPV
jgi:Predicted nucleotide-binding protein containing TIR-like domain